MPEVTFVPSSAAPLQAAGAATQGEQQQQSFQRDQERAEVQAFLEETFRAEGREMPPWRDEDERDMGELLRIARVSRERSARAGALARTYRAVAEEYLREGGRQAEVLREVGVSESQLSHAGRASVAALAKMAADLGVGNCKPSSLLAAATEASFRAWDEEDASMRWETRDTELQGELTLAESRLADLRPLVERLDAGVEESQATSKTKRENLKMLDQKEKQYHQQLSNYREALTRAGARMEIRHSVLAARAGEREKLAGELAPLKAELARYGDLPPDKMQVQRAVEEKARRLNELQRLLEDQLGGLPSTSL